MEEHEDLSPQRMLQLLGEQQRHVERAQLAPVPWLYGTWGVAWLVGFLALWSTSPAGNPWFTVPGPLAAGVFGALITSSVVASAIIGSRINRGVRGTSTFGGVVYGLSWPLCGTAFALVGTGLIANGMSSELASIYFPSAYALMCGALYLGGAALWRDGGQLAVAIALLAVGAIAPYFGAPGNNLFMALAAGGTFLAAAVVVAKNPTRGR
ncbi:hypothetical protein [Cryobacterium tepidiphilum]|uniref:Uncharacterized protein n=1 Tax=Cryobacterium tepidiphilum TaxID=2486026 RepID=A0A3M8LGS5_9MICO|nr:hypothetical protein [Cryobacterium tepidiphilum]RNE64099.1 hypothetical protein EEJ31_04275 [Cryobacterium tepidiphilum]